jgi:molybdopterin converting factor small subunit
MAKVKYFGVLAESVAKGEEEVVIDSKNLQELVVKLTEKYSLDAFDFQIAVNRKIIQNLGDFNVEDSDEIAFLPAFAGG